MNARLPLVISIPHSNERIPSEAVWLKRRAEHVLLRDVDRFVDWLYQPALDQLGIQAVEAKCHRYVIDLNRFKSDVHPSIVQGALAGTGKLIHWKATTFEEPLMDEPLDLVLHQHLVNKYYVPFFQRIQEKLDFFLKAQGRPDVYHLDLHSMPSKGRAFHGDAGQQRAQVVISDYYGTTSKNSFAQLVIESYKAQGFQVAYNDPYVGGGITRYFGKPYKGQNTLQIELNRSLYMDEQNYERSPQAVQIQKKLQAALESIAEKLKGNC